MKLLVIRPQPGADATAGRITALGHQAILMPMFALRAIAWDVPDGADYDALLLTSGNAVRLAGDGLAALSDLPVYAVGTATARAVTHAGLTVTATGEVGAEAILALANAAGHSRLLWLAGRDRMMVEQAGVDIRTVYESEALPASQDFRDVVTSADAVLLHSQRAAAHFAWLCDTQNIPRQNIAVGALSFAIAQRAGSGWHDLFIADDPNDAALLSCVASGSSKMAE